MTWSYISPTLETIHSDVFDIIANELRCTKGQLCSLASTSRSLRAKCFPLLFSHCKAATHGDSSSGLPPPMIRPFVRTLTYCGHVDKDHHSAITLGKELDHLPNVRSVVFANTVVRWKVLKKCLTYPLTSIVISDTASFDTRERTHSIDGTIIENSLTHFSYQVGLWREVDSELCHTNFEEILAAETNPLSAVVLGMNTTAESLELPVETAPLIAMAGLPWPRLRRLCLHGQHRDSANATLLSPLLARMPHLETLSVQVTRMSLIGRPPLLSNAHLSSSTLPRNLRSLTIAHPNPKDAIFSLNLSGLTHLSLRDTQRYYHRLGWRGTINGVFRARILSAKEALSILARLEMPVLVSLELVYTTDETEDELLCHLVKSFPLLERLELHRYRLNRYEVVPYVHILELLAGATALRHAYLNLDFHEDPGPYWLHFRNYGPRGGYEDWTEVIEDRGWEALDIMQSCPRLEYVALLLHRYPSSAWVEFYPSRGVQPRWKDLRSDEEDEAPFPCGWP